MKASGAEAGPLYPADRLTGRPLCRARRLGVGGVLALATIGGMLAGLQTPLSAQDPAEQLVIDDFESVDDWSGLELETVNVHGGSGAGRWEDHPTVHGVSKRFDNPLGLSRRLLSIPTMRRNSSKSPTPSIHSSVSASSCWPNTKTGARTE